MTRYKINIEYDGTNLVGWQKQKNGISIQEIIENSLYKLTGEKIKIQGAGRTDSNVHALNQVAHFDLKKKIKTDSIRDGLNFHIKNLYKRYKVSILKCKKVKKKFNAIFDAKERTYLYKILDRRSPPTIQNKRVWHVKKKLDDKLMKKVAKVLVGKHDFTTFRAVGCQASSPVKTLDYLGVEGDEGLVLISTRARSFLYHQVRNMVGTLKLVGLGKWSADNVAEALAARDRAKGGPTAPPQGLYLTKVGY